MYTIVYSFSLIWTHKKIGTPSPTFLKYNHRKRSFWMDSIWFLCFRGATRAPLAIAIYGYEVTINDRLLLFSFLAKLLYLFCESANYNSRFLKVKRCTARESLVTRDLPALNRLVFIDGDVINYRDRVSPSLLPV